MVLVMLSRYSITNNTADIIDDCGYGFCQLYNSFGSDKNPNLRIDII